MSPADSFVLRTVYIDPDVDGRLHAEAKAAQASKAGLLRRYLTAGRRRARAQPELVRAMGLADRQVPLVLQTVHLDVKLDHSLVVEAFDTGLSRNDLLRTYLHLGFDAQRNTTKP